MKHKKNGRELGRERNQRIALFRTMLGSLIINERIKTTQAKAKELKGRIDKIINKAKKSKDESRKLSIRRDLKKDIPEIAVKKITGDFLSKFNNRNSGYTRIIKLSPRKSDGAEVAIIEFV